MLMVDEASTFTVPHLLSVIDSDEHENATGPQVVAALQETWIRFFGHPSTLRLDPEGAFRSRALEEFCGSRDIELEHCAAEAHYQIGVVERAIGTLRRSVEKYLRTYAVDPWEAIMAMCAAHNDLGKVGGFSPNQWALGRSFGLSEKLHEDKRDGHSFHSAQADPQEQLHSAMTLRIRAEEEYRRMLAQDAINRAWNSKAKKAQVWSPGTLVVLQEIQSPFYF